MPQPSTLEHSLDLTESLPDYGGRRIPIFMDRELLRGVLAFFSRLSARIEFFVASDGKAITLCVEPCGRQCKSTRVWWRSGWRLLKSDMIQDASDISPGDECLIQSYHSNHVSKIHVRIEH